MELERCNLFSDKEIKVFLKGQAKDTYEKLEQDNNKYAKTLLNSINRAIIILKENPQYGQPIAKQLIPEKYLKEGIKNLYRIELSNFWRLLYTIEGSKIEIFLFILDIHDHKGYNKLFGYK